MLFQDSKVLNLKELNKDIKEEVKKDNGKIDIKKVENIDKSKDKRDKHRKILENKKLDYQLKLDKKYLSDELKLMQIDKDNEFTVKEAKTKNNQDILILKAGKQIAKMCLILTFISCLMTIGGNIDIFICNIPLLKDQNPDNYIFVWTKILSSKQLERGISQDIVQHLRFNIVTSMIYIPFVIALQTILYQVSINLYSIRTKFAKYYLHAVLLQYSMLIYSVYSNYKFLSYYTRPNTVFSMFLTFIPALLLDIGCIFFLSLSQDNKSLNYHTEKIESLYKSVVDLFNKKDKNNLKNSPKDSLKLGEISTKNLKDSSIKDNYSLVENSNLKNEKIPINFKLEKGLKNEENKNAVDLERVSQGNKKEDIKNDEIKDKKKVISAKENISKFTTKKVTGNSSNKVKNADIKRVKSYIKKLAEKGIEKVKIEDLKAKCKIDKNRWLEIKKILVEEGLLYLSDNKRNTFININQEV